MNNVIITLRTNEEIKKELDSGVIKKHDCINLKVTPSFVSRHIIILIHKKHLLL